MQALNPITLRLSGRTLLEASAGTGKTWTLSLLVLRLVVEEEKCLNIDQILVLTFTKAATAELRSRIRSRIRQALIYLRSGRDAGLAELDAQEAQALDAIFAQAPSEEMARQRLENATSRMEEAAITTIHGFCQRVLQERAFEAGLAFDQQVLTDEQALLEETTADFWRSRFYPMTREESEMVRAHWKSPLELLRELEKSLTLEDDRILPHPDPEKLAHCLEQVRDGHAKLVQLWEAEKGDIIGQLADTSLWRKNGKYHPGKLPDLQAKLEEVLASAVFPRILPEELENLRSEVLEKSLLLKAAKDKQLQPHPFFTIFEVFWSAHSDVHKHWRLHQLFAARAYLRNELARRKREQRRFGYNDMITQVDEALRRQPALACTLGERYPAILVDEFQDTDPVQYRIFSAISQTPGHRLFCMIGDPKQAIYSFRGGDIFTYLEAKKDTENAPDGQCLTMNRNFRSAPGMIGLVNTLFGRAQPPPFVLRGMDFQPVEHGGKATDCDFTLDGRPLLPLNILYLPSEDTRKNGQVEAEAVRACAQAIKTVLTPGRARLGERALESRDVAVLVQTHKQAERVKTALAELGLASVYAARESVFGSREAAELATLLAALLDPTNRELARAALATSLFGLNAQDLRELENSADKAGEYAHELRDYQALWQKRGVCPMLHRLLRRRKVAGRLSAWPDGERRLTNFLHLAELAGQAAEEEPGMERLSRWLARARQEADTKNEEALIRLESDENLVRITTWHSSKGLEYPLVFLPFLWHAKQQRGMPKQVSFHDRETFQAYFNFAPKKKNKKEPELADEEQKENKNERDLADEEQQSEQMRLLYVALTRARYTCFACWGRAKALEQTPMARLVLQGEPCVDDGALKEKLAELNRGADLVRCLEPDNPLPVEDGDAKNAAGTEPGAPPPVPRTFTGKIALGYINRSYSGMVKEKDALAAGDADEDFFPEREAVRPQEDCKHIATFPKGPQAGSCLHSLLESLDFGEPASAQANLVEEKLAAFGFRAEWRDALISWLELIVRHKLPGSRPLFGLAPEDARRELKFWFPVEAYIPLCDCFNLPQKDRTPSLGLLTGSIDLCFRHNGRFYLVDYKSNHLGMQPGDYTKEAMQASILEHHYEVQYKLYTLALHRLLRARLHAYDYERHFGGVYYLFLRGMGGEAGQGVFSDRPAWQEIAALDKLCREAKP